MENNPVSLKYAAYIPCYNNGNSVIALLNDGSSSIIYRSIKSQLAILLREHNIDIHSLRKNLSISTGRSTLIPIPLSLGIVLIPVKVRKTISANDGSYAYIVLSEIKEVIKDKYAVLKLSSGYEINSLESVRSVNKRISIGNMVSREFASSVLGGYNLREGISEAAFEYTRPATKGDLCMLAYEIMRLRRMVERRGDGNGGEGGEENDGVEEIRGE